MPHLFPDESLVLGGTGKTGRRVAERLRSRGLPVRIGSRSAEVPFDWNHSTTWNDALAYVSQVYVSYYPDVAIPGTANVMRSFTEVALSRGVRREVLLSGRGEAEAERCEHGVQRALGRPPRDFSAYVRDSAATGIWSRDGIRLSRSQILRSGQAPHDESETADFT